MFVFRDLKSDGELKLVGSSVQPLLKDLESALTDRWQQDWDLAVQPLRMENMQLRRYASRTLQFVTPESQFFLS